MARQPKVQLVIDGKDNTKGAFGTLNKSLGAIEKRTMSVGKAMAGAFAGLVSIATIKRIASINMEFRQLDRVLKENTESTEAFNYAQEETMKIANDLGVSLDKVINNFGGLNGSLAALGYGSKEAIKVTETLSKLMTLEGADPGPTIKRFTRALSKGELHQARFNLMLQDQPALLDLISEATGRTIKELRELSATGELTADMMVDAVVKMSDKVDERYQELPKTIDQAMAQIGNTISESFRDEELMQPIVDSLHELAEVLKDPAVREGLAALASSLASAAAGGAAALSEAGEMFASASHAIADATGAATELEKLEYKLRQVERSLNNTGMSSTLGGLLIPEAELKRQKAAIEEQIDLIKSGHEEGIRLTKEITALRNLLATPAPLREGSTLKTDNEIKEALRALEARRSSLAETVQAEKEGNEKLQGEIREQHEKEQKLRRKYIADLKKHTGDAVKAVEQRGKELADAERNAAKKVLDSKTEADKLLKQFDDIAAGFGRGGKKGEPRFLDYQVLATSARQALVSGDTEKAKEDALAAAELLKELAATRENTYGFAGLTKQMQDVAKAATEIEQANAEAELEAIRQQMADLAKQAEELKDMPVSMELDDASLDDVRGKIQKLLDDLKIEAVIPVRMATEGGADIPGFARGGHIRGPGTGTSDSILARLSDGEFVMRAAAVRKYGTDMLHQMNNMRIPKFATGGLVDSVAAMEPKQPQALGTLNFNLGSDSFSVNTTGDWSDDLRRAALKYGRPTRR